MTLSTMSFLGESEFRGVDRLTSMRIGRIVHVLRNVDFVHTGEFSDIRSKFLSRA